MFIYASSTPSSRKEYIWQKETIFWPHIYTLNVGTRKRLHDIPRFSTLFLGQEILIIIYRTYKISLAFKLLQISTGDTWIVFLAQPAVGHLTVKVGVHVILHRLLREGYIH